MTEARWVLDVDEIAPLWDECPRCAYLAGARKFPRPTATVDDGVARVTRAVQEHSLDKLAPGAPAGRSERSSRLVSGAYDVPLPDAVERCAITATPDVVLRGDAGTTIAVVVVNEPDDRVLSIHARRLHAAAWALERPARGASHPVTGLGVLVWVPGDKLAGAEAGTVALTGRLAWRTIGRDDTGFLGFVAEAIALLSQSSPPPGTALCPWCVYRDVARRTGL